MRVRRPFLVRLATLAALVMVATSMSGCLPDEIELGLMPMTSHVGHPNSVRHGLDVHDGQASWVEADASGRGPVKYLALNDAGSTIATQALSAWTAIGGYGTLDHPLVAYRTDTSGVHIVNPLTSVETTFLAGVEPSDFGGVHVATQVQEGGVTYLRTIDVRDGTTFTYDSIASGAFDEVRVQDNWISWKTGDSMKVAWIGGGGSTTVPPVGTGVTIERVWASGMSLSWTERDSGGYRRIYYRPQYSAETTEIVPGGPSKELGGFDGDYITWFEGYGTSAARARAVAVEWTYVHEPGDQLTYPGYDPSEFAWDFDTLLWQQRGSNNLYLTRFRMMPPRVKGANRYETLANMAALRAGVRADSVKSVRVAEQQGVAEVRASAEADSQAPIVPDVVVTAGYANGSPDAIVAPGLAGVYSAPMLLVNYKSVPAVTVTALNRLREAGGGAVNIHVIGGTAAISKSCYATLSGLKGAGTIDRVGGRDRYDTAARVAYRMRAVLASRGATMGPGVMLLNGSDRTKWDDAASTGAIAAGRHIPVLFLRRYSVPAYTKAALTKLRPPVRYIIGGTSNVSEPVRRALRVSKSNRISGKNKYATSMAVVRWGRAKGWLAPSGVFVAGYLHEALAAGGYSVLFYATPNTKIAVDQPQEWAAAPVVLSPPKALHGAFASYLAEPVEPTGHTQPFLVGGEYSVSSNAVRQMLEIIGDWWRILVR